MTPAADNSDVDPINDADDDNDDNDDDADNDADADDDDDDLSSFSLVETTKSDSAKDVERIKN